MTLNCRKSDIARITGLPPALVDLRDRFVTCVDLFHHCGDPFWRFERRITVTIQGNGARNMYTGQMYSKGDRLEIDALPDSCLRPIRGGDGDDQTFEWAGKPNETVHEFIEGLTKERASCRLD